MKLVNKFILVYLLVTAIVLSVGGVISFYLIKDEIDDELRWQHLNSINRMEEIIDHPRNRGRIERFQNDEDKWDIRRLNSTVDKEWERVADTTIYNDHLDRMEQNLKVAAYRNIDGKGYYISTWGTFIESEDIVEAIVKTLLWILGLQVMGAIGVGLVVSGRLFKPFRTTLDKIRNFKLQDQEPIKAVDTSVKEFDELNRFVGEMTTKAISDYQNLKEFAENASHELQTPLSIAQGKLELLTETELNSEQFQYVESAQSAIRKLSKLSESLGLLTKIENHEFVNSQKVNFTKLIKDSLNTFEELIALNGLDVKSHLEEDVEVPMHPVLADILWTNLLQNAIKHNVNDGYIDIKLTKQQLVVANTGKALKVDPDILFRRFKKADQSTSSIGLGLSIIKRIVNQSEYDITYTYDDSDLIHSITVYFETDSGDE